ncbi:MAG: hypothetical protein IKW93_05745 [Bacteroidales bacterium]|nr:hypothetical protein [Bacteroidales bacterium]
MLCRAVTLWQPQRNCLTLKKMTLLGAIPKEEGVIRMCSELEECATGKDLHHATHA